MAKVIQGGGDVDVRAACRARRGMLRATTAAALPGSVLGSRSRPVSPIREEMTEPTGPKPQPPVPPCPPLAPPCKGQMGSRGLEWWGTGHQWQRGIAGVPTPTVGLPYTLVDPPTCSSSLHTGPGGAEGSGRCMCVFRAGRGSPSSQCPEPGPAPWPSHLSWSTPRCCLWRLGYRFRISHTAGFPLYLRLIVHKKINGPCK